MKITLGIVYYQNSQGEITTLLHSIKKNINYLTDIGFFPDIQVLFYDNSNLDSDFFTQFSIDQSLKIEVLSSGENLGFGKGHNRLMEKAFSENSDAYIALNPDGFLHYKAIYELWTLSKESNHQSLIEARQVPVEQPKIYDPLTFRIGEQKTYVVNEKFPRIRRRDVPKEIQAIQYDLRISNLKG